MVNLPFASADLLLEKHYFDIFAHEKKYGNTDLIRLIEIAGIAGPYKQINPWIVEDKEGIQRIHAGGYSALPFGESYPPLIQYLQEFLKNNTGLCLPQTAVSKWRAALEANLINLLAQITPQHKNSKLFFSNSGTEAMECALKLVKAYKRQAKYLINFTGAYHGKTLGSLSITPNKHYQAPFEPLIPNIITLPYNDKDALLSKIDELGSDNIIAIVMEVVQGEAGVIIPSQEFIKTIKHLTQTEKILLVADEIQTGLGRGGYWFTSIEWAKLDPDVIALAKPLGGGLIPIGVTIAKEDLFKCMFGGLNCKTHSNTFGGGSLAMAVGLKSLDLIYSEELVSRAKHLGDSGLKRLQAIAKKYPELIEEVRGFGLLFAIQFRLPIKTDDPLINDFIGELTGLLGILALNEAKVLANFSLNASRTIRLTPALNIPEDLFNQMFDCVELMAKTYQSTKNLLSNPVIPKIIHFVNSSAPEASDLMANLITMLQPENMLS